MVGDCDLRRRGWAAAIAIEDILDELFFVHLQRLDSLSIVAQTECVKDPSKGNASEGAQRGLQISTTIPFAGRFRSI